jgi:hypothetical protein
MRPPSELAHAELAALVGAIQQFLYADVDDDGNGNGANQ